MAASTLLSPQIFSVCGTGRMRVVLYPALACVSIGTIGNMIESSDLSGCVSM